MYSTSKVSFYTKTQCIQRDAGVRSCTCRALHSVQQMQMAYYMHLNVTHLFLESSNGFWAFFGVEDHGSGAKLC
jgi:hypothetical protein